MCGCSRPAGRRRAAARPTGRGRGRCRRTGRCRAAGSVAAGGVRGRGSAGTTSPRGVLGLRPGGRGCSRIGRRGGRPATATGRAGAGGCWRDGPAGWAGGGAVGAGEGEQEFGWPAVDPPERPAGLGEDSARVPVEMAAQHRQMGVLVQVEAQPHIVIADQHLTRQPVPFAVPLPGCLPLRPRRGTGGEHGRGDGPTGRVQDGAAPPNPR